MSETAIKQTPLDTHVDTTGADTGTLLRMRMRGLTYQEIGAKVGLTPQAIHQRLQRFKDLISDTEILQAVEDSKVDIYRSAEIALITDLVDPERRQKASLNNTAYALRQVHDMRQIREQQPTELIGIAAHLQVSQQADDEIAKLERELAKLMGSNTSDKVHNVREKEQVYDITQDT